MELVFLGSCENREPVFGSIGMEDECRNSIEIGRVDLR
jgi:hypothetical protein